MAKINVMQAIHRIDRTVFTTRDIAVMTGSSIGSVTQSLKRLEKADILKKVSHGVWALIHDKKFSPFLVIPYILQNHRGYISFISALHNYGVIGQIPQTITIASTAHTKKINTSVGVFSVHQIAPSFFDGFEWNEIGDYLIATPEKAFVDCLYLASRKKNQFTHFPELDLSPLDPKKIEMWVKKIPDRAIRRSVETMLTGFHLRGGKGEP